MEKLKIVVTDSRGRVWKGELERIAPTPGRRIELETSDEAMYRYSTHIIDPLVRPLDVCRGSGKDVTAKVHGGDLIGLSNFSPVAMCPVCERFVIVLEKANDRPAQVRDVVQCRILEWNEAGTHKRHCVLDSGHPTGRCNFSSWVLA